MRTATILSIAIASLCLAPAAFAQRALSSTEIQDLLKQLTDRPRKTWISAGTIQGTHREYGAAKVTSTAIVSSEIDKAIREYEQNAGKTTLSAEMEKMKLDAIPLNVRYEMSNEYAMTCREVVKYDGERFYWDLTLVSRSDSIPLDPALQGNWMVNHFKEHEVWNRHRIFAWDGQKYTTYFVDGGQATVDAASKLPRPVNGPLTAGLIPWGHAKFSAASLAGAKVSAQETGTTIKMTIGHADGTSTQVALDRSRAYAVTTATLTGANDFSVTYTCSGYQSIGGNWVPSTVTIERKNCGEKNKAATSEQWTDIKVTSTSAPSLGSFNVPVALDATIEYLSPVSDSPAVYTNSYEVNMEELLAERLAYAAGTGSRVQNCATAALSHVAAEFGKSIPSNVLARLVGPDGRTGINNMKQLAQSLGLYCRVVKADVETLKNLGRTKAILHIASKNHFAVLDRVDDMNVWLIDPSSKKFYYSQSVHFLPMDWTAGTTLLVSDRPIQAQVPELPAAASAQITGGYWTCNTLYQEEDWLGCTYLSGFCMGTCTYWPERWVCGTVPSGSCPWGTMLQRQEIACVPDPIYECTVGGSWYAWYMRACM